MENLLQETNSILARHGKTCRDVEWVGNTDKYMMWDDFEKEANFEYDDGFGGEEINTSLLVVGKNFWLERHEYDGHEWWEYKEQPKKPKIYGDVNLKNSWY